MASRNDVVVRLRAVGQAAFTSAMKEASSSVRGVGSASDRAASSAERAGKSGERAGRTWRRAAGGLAKYAAGGAAVYAAQRYVRDAVSSTEDLAKATLGVQRVTGMDARTASGWVEITKARGINAKQFQVGLVKLSKTMDAARQGNAKATATLQGYGVNADQIAKGDTAGAIGRLADSFALMKSPAERAAQAQALFGKGGQALLPLLMKGSKGIQEQLDLVHKYGAELGSTDSAKKMALQQQKLRYATDGLKVSLGEALLPTILSATQAFNSFVAVMQPVLRSGTAVKVILAGVATAFAVMKVNAIMAAFGVGTLNIAFLAIPLAIAAIVAGVVILYHKWGWFHRAVNNTWAFIKTHWPLLLAILTGPFGIAVVLIVKHLRAIRAAARSIPHAFRAAFDTVKSIADSAIHWVADRFRDLGSLIGRVVSGIKSVPGKALGKVRNALPFAEGGVVPSGGRLSLVGELGPELLQLPGGSRITPMTSPTMSSSTPSIGGMQTTAQFFLDRRLVGTAVARDTSDQAARR